MREYSRMVLKCMLSVYESTKKEFILAHDLNEQTRIEDCQYYANAMFRILNMIKEKDYSAYETLLCTNEETIRLALKVLK